MRVVYRTLKQGVANLAMLSEENRATEITHSPFVLEHILLFKNKNILPSQGYI